MEITVLLDIHTNKWYPKALRSTDWLELLPTYKYTNIHTNIQYTTKVHVIPKKDFSTVHIVNYIYYRKGVVRIHFTLNMFRNSEFQRNTMIVINMFTQVINNLFNETQEFSR